MHCPGQPIRVALRDDGERFEVVVTDVAPADADGTPAQGSSAALAAPDGDRADSGAAPATSAAGVILQLPAGVGLAVITGLADDVRISPAAEGTSVAMSWKRRSATA